MRCIQGIKYKVHKKSLQKTLSKQTWSGGTEVPPRTPSLRRACSGCKGTQHEGTTAPERDGRVRALERGNRAGRRWAAHPHIDSPAMKEWSKPPCVTKDTSCYCAAVQHARHTCSACVIRQSASPHAATACRTRACFSAATPGDCASCMCSSFSADAAAAFCAAAFLREAGEARRVRDTVCLMTRSSLE